MASEADEVAEDYRHALEDLSSNMRFEISNLTVIARENTEHALAIAEVLQQHILKAPPSKKLPSLYVLDSIVKNVGTPYTLYFGRNLFKTFMESYAVVDGNVRRKMEEMLKTWKDPVPGSMDTRPVFSHELVRPIENALMKARAATMPQQGPIPGRPRSSLLPHRDTPTPPGTRGPNGPPGPYPPQFAYPNGGRPGDPVPYHAQPQVRRRSSPPPPADYGLWTNRLVTRQYSGILPTPQLHGSTPAIFQPPLAGPYGSIGARALAGVSVETLSNDIQNLIVAAKAEFTQNPHDASIQNRLRALLDLQGLVQRASLPPDQLELIKNKVTELAAVTRKAPSSHTLLAPVPAYMAPLSQPAPPPAPPPPHSASVTPNPVSATEPKPQITLDSLLGPGAMAALMARHAAASHSATSTPPIPDASVRSSTSLQTQAPKPASSTPKALLEQLRQAGMLPSSAPAKPAPPAAAPPVTPQPILPPNITSILASAKAAAVSQQGFGGVSTGSINEAALKQQ
ncbi:hypothetical protein UVI_02042250 [Ustilaginoidea virens]|uniref:CID domain-containing protein n=1 Tax=Ustilaginoidea virens TaxID=1159556 RepID=A0A1B5L4T3_USTVR|nr:hypothetical protein UVI_02042250 [Ustilaginoidea virens]